MLRSVLSRAMLLTVAILLLFANVQATDVVLTHQGRLLDSADEPVTGPIDITFRIFDVPTGGVPLWTELHAAVAVSDGLFTTTLGSITPMSSDALASVSSTQPRWLEVEISGSPIVPRVLLGSTPSSAVSTRVLGDIQTEPGILTVSNGSGTKGVVMRASDTNNGIAIDEEGVQRFVVNSHNSPGDSHVRMAVGDLTGDGRTDLVVSPDSIVNQYVQDDTPDGEKVYAVRLTPSNVGMELKHSGSTTLTLGTASSDASVRASSGSGGGGGGGSVGTMEMRATPDSAVSVLKSEDSGTSGQTSFTVTARFEDRTTSDMTYDADGNGIPESSVQQESRPGGATMKAIQTKGTGAIASVKMEASDSTGIIAVSDLDGDGNPEALASTFIVEEVEFVVEKVERDARIDVNDDGIPESSIEETCSLGGTTMKAITTKGTGANGIIRMDAGDSVGVSASSDVDGDGNSESSMRGLVSGLTPGTTNIAATYLDVDDDDDGIPESSVQLESRPGGATMKAIQTKGTGAIASVRMDAGDSANTSVETDADGDGNPEASCLTRVHSSGIGFVDIRTSVDSNDDGTSDYSSESHVGAVSVAYKLLDSSGDPASIDFTVGNDRPQITLTQVGIDRCIVSPDSGIQLSNSSAVKTVDIHDNGIIYVAGGMEIGMTGGTHHIDVAGGAYCDGTNWVNASDKNAKENFENVNGEELLEKIAQLDITKWNYKGDSDAQHIGPTAQDFKKTFGVGADDKSISTIDPSGIALAAIKELYAQLQAKDNEMKKLREEMAKLKKEFSKKK